MKAVLAGIALCLRSLAANAAHTRKSMCTFIKAALAATAATFFIAVPAHATAVLQVNSAGLLTGATGVDVDGVLYEVAFVEGTCSGLFDGCHSTSDFTFQTEAAASAASVALLAQVFVDGPQGNFDAVNALTYGCSSNSYGTCTVMTPYKVQGDNFWAAFAWNWDKDPYVDDETGGTAFTYAFDSFDTSVMGQYVWAAWTLSAAQPGATVPEPSSLALLGLAVVALGGSQRRRRI